MAGSFSDITSEDIERKSFNDELVRLNRGVVLAWVLNFIILLAAVMALLSIMTLQDVQSMEDLRIRLLFNALISSGVALLVLLIIYMKPNGMLMHAMGGSMTQVQSGRVHNIVEEICIASGVTGDAMPSVYIVEGTGILNAYAVSDGKSSNVIVTDELVHALNRAELQAVIAHEMGHVNSGDCVAMTRLIAMTNVVGIISELGLDILCGGSTPAKRHRRRMREESRESSSDSKSGADSTAALIGLGIAFLGVMFLIFAPAISIAAKNHMSRTRESRADTYSVQYTRNPTALATALIRIEQLQGNDEFKGSDKRFLKKAGNLAFYAPALGRNDATHPDTKTRIHDLIVMGADEGRIRVAIDHPRTTINLNGYDDDEPEPDRNTSRPVRRNRQQYMQNPNAMGMMGTPVGTVHNASTASNGNPVDTVDSVHTVDNARTVHTVDNGNRVGSARNAHPVDNAGTVHNGSDARNRARVDSVNPFTVGSDARTGEVHNGGKRRLVRRRRDGGQRHVAR